jgi:hypothetical protein
MGLHANAPRPHRPEAGQLDSDWITGRWVELARTGRSLRAQVHKHPGEAFPAYRSGARAETWTASSTRWAKTPPVEPRGLMAGRVGCGDDVSPQPTDCARRRCGDCSGTVRRASKSAVSTNRPSHAHHVAAAFMGRESAQSCAILAW